jgi:hypothetical protein
MHPNNILNFSRKGKYCQNLQVEHAVIAVAPRLSLAPLLTLIKPVSEKFLAFGLPQASLETMSL